MHHLIVDGMLSGTGIRDSVNGGYLSTKELGLSAELICRLSGWLARYEDAHYEQFEDRRAVTTLDREGVDLARMLQRELPSSRVEYFSSAELRRVPVEGSGGSPGSPDHPTQGSAEVADRG